MIPSGTATWGRRLQYLLPNVIVFALCYNLANFMAQQAGVTTTIATQFDASVPFLPWMIVPYLSSGIILLLGFALAKTSDDLRVLGQRLLLATVSATLIFAIFPLAFGFTRPAIPDDPLPAALFDFLALVDKPFNQFPSLHVAYCVILWPAFQRAVRPGPARHFLLAWLVLVASSTIFTYQHHMLDVAGGVLLGALSLKLIRPGTLKPAVGFYYLMCSAVLLLAGVLALESWFALYIAASLALVSLAYYRSEPGFLHKKDGKFPFWVRLAYAPYLAGYWATWHLVRFRERGKPPFLRISPQLIVGRRLTDKEAGHLPSDCSVIDAANELSEAAPLRARRYFHFPLFDLHAPSHTALAELVAAIDAELRAGRTVYLHCAMGYSRSVLIAQHYLNHIGKHDLRLPA